MAEYSFPVEAGHVMLFARAIGDNNPVYRDAAAAKAAGLAGIVAPPTFAMASAQFDPGFPLRPVHGRPWMGSGATPTGLAKRSEATPVEAAEPQAPGANTLHAEQRFEFSRPVLVGDVLSPTQRIGRQWDKQSRSGATLTFVESITEFRDPGGDLVVTATSVAVTTHPPKLAESGERSDG